MKISLMLLFLMCLFLVGCSTSNDWTAFYYPDANNIGDESTWTIQAGLSSLDECRGFIEDIAGNNNNYDYECGYKCRYESDYGMNICKETLN